MQLKKDFLQIYRNSLKVFIFSRSVYTYLIPTVYLTILGGTLEDTKRLLEHNEDEFFPKATIKRAISLCLTSFS